MFENCSRQPGAMEFVTTEQPKQQGRRWGRQLRSLTKSGIFGVEQTVEITKIRVSREGWKAIR